MEKLSNAFVDSCRFLVGRSRVNRCIVRFVVYHEHWQFDHPGWPGIVGSKPVFQILENPLVLLHHEKDRFTEGAEPETELVHERCLEVMVPGGKYPGRAHPVDKTNP